VCQRGCGGRRYDAVSRRSRYDHAPSSRWAIPFELANEIVAGCRRVDHVFHGSGSGGRYRAKIALAAARSAARDFTRLIGRERGIAAWASAEFAGGMVNNRKFFAVAGRDHFAPRLARRAVTHRPIMVRRGRPSACRARCEHDRLASSAGRWLDGCAAAARGICSCARYARVRILPILLVIGSDVSAPFAAMLRCRPGHDHHGQGTTNGAWCPAAPCA
jgi:hypothetical protein